MKGAIEFVHPYFLWLLLIIPLLITWYLLRGKKQNATLTISTADAFGPQHWMVLLRKYLPVIRLVALVLLILALSGPQKVSVTTKTKSNKGIDIVMAVDVSASMLATDLKPNRLEALKNVAESFINDRTNDRIGIVIYAGESYTKTPITSDKNILINNVKQIKFGEIEDGTAIGMGLGAAVNRLKGSKSKSKVIILLTDGVNNTGFIDPTTATELAKEMNIKVYTIALGTNGYANFPYAKDPRTGQLRFRQQKVEIDEKLLQQIAKETNGKYFRATDNSKLAAIYEEINKLEKTKIQTFKYYSYETYFRILILIALVLLLVEWILKHTIFKSFI